MELVKRIQCTGCMACVEICPKECIQLETDVLGHIYPTINLEQCVSCGNCQKVCPENNKLKFQTIQKAYAVWSLDNENRKSSASGGAASEFYAKAIEDGYWICGVEYQKKFHAVHILSKHINRIEKFKQSKYVYSEVGDVYKKIKQLLSNKEQVLFISLPCKVAGLLGYLGKYYENLVTVDIVCHGTPSYQNLKEHIDSQDERGVATSVRFRQDNEFMFLLENAKKRKLYCKIGQADTYLAAFLEGLNYRESCYRCSYARPERISDITICDFWGLGQEIPFNHPYTGAISAVLINSAKGDLFFESCRKNFFVEQRPVIEAIKGNAQLNEPTKKHSKREEFECLYKEYGFEKAVNQCLKQEIQLAKRSNLKKLVRKKIRSFAGIFIKRYRG